MYNASIHETCIYTFKKLMLKLFYNYKITAITWPQFLHILDTCWVQNTGYGSMSYNLQQLHVTFEHDVLVQQCT